MSPEVGLAGLVKDATTHSTVIVRTVAWLDEPFVGVYVPSRLWVPATPTSVGATVRVCVLSSHVIQAGNAPPSLYTIEPEA